LSYFIMPTISVPLDSELVGELYLRAGHPATDIGSWIENVVRDYLDRTADDGDWADAYYSWREKAAGSEAFQSEFGDPKGGYRWGTLFMPNGTLVRMEYKRQTYQATVKFDKIDYKGETHTPSELASKIAAGTSRNAWRDLMVKRPGDTEWCLADELRRVKRGA
jgi:hypothetical protein